MITGRTAVSSFVAACLIVMAAPLAGRGVLAIWGPPPGPRSYLPALEATRPRAPFEPGAIEDLQGMQPGYVIIGDSMAGRVEPIELTRLANQPVAPIPQPATGSAFWYLVLKNYVVASGIKPEWIVVFFRDTNLTDPTFRLAGPYRDTLDKVARDDEPELNEVVAARTTGRWHRLHRVVDRVYGSERLRTWIEPGLVGWPARVVIGTRRREALLEELNASFGLDRLRTMTQADIEADAHDTDFHANVGSSLLPRFIDLARRHDLRLVFVRALRRPDRGKLPAETPALRQYIKDLRAYLAGERVAFLDDRDDPELRHLEYEDGDHIMMSERGAYTARLFARLQSLPR